MHKTKLQEKDSVEILFKQFRITKRLFIAWYVLCGRCIEFTVAKEQPREFQTFDENKPYATYYERTLPSGETVPTVGDIARAALDASKA